MEGRRSTPTIQGSERFAMRNTNNVESSESRGEGCCVMAGAVSHSYHLLLFSYGEFLQHGEAPR